MTRTQFLILNGTVALVGLLFIAEIFLSWRVSLDEQQFAVLQRVAQEESFYTSHWQQMAVRTYQLGQQDPGLKDILKHQQITISPKPSTNSPSATPPNTDVPLPPASAPAAEPEPAAKKARPL